MDVIDKFAPMKERRVKQNSQKWFDGEIADELKIAINYLEKLKNKNYVFTKIFMMW